MFIIAYKDNSFSISFDCCLLFLFTDCAESIRFSFVSSFFGLDFYFIPFLSGKWTKWEGGISNMFDYISLDRFMFYLYVIPPIPTPSSIGFVWFLFTFLSLTPDWFLIGKNNTRQNVGKRSPPGSVSNQQSILYLSNTNFNFFYSWLIPTLYRL